MRRLLAVVSMAGALLFVLSAGGSAATTKSLLFHDGDVVRTVVNSGAIPNQGTDPFYSVTNGAEGQLGIAGVAPGDEAYHGGSWQVYLVTFNEGVEPYLLTSDEAVFAAEAAGDVTVVRDGSADFRCPIQP